MVKNNMRHNFTTKCTIRILMKSELLSCLWPHLSVCSVQDDSYFFLFAIKGCFTKMDNNVLLFEVNIAFI